MQPVKVCSFIKNLTLKKCDIGPSLDNSRPTFLADVGKLMVNVCDNDARVEGIIIVWEYEAKILIANKTTNIVENIVLVRTFRPSTLSTLKPGLHLAYTHRPKVE